MLRGYRAPPSRGSATSRRVLVTGSRTWTDTSGDDRHRGHSVNHDDWERSSFGCARCTPRDEGQAPPRHADRSERPTARAWSSSTLCRGGHLWDDQGVSPTDGVPDLLDALSRGRTAVDEHTSLAEEFESSWREETASEILWVHSAPFVRYADFTRQQESRVGADWLWWWVDADRQCFGILVQAKRIHYRGDTPELDLRAKGGNQMRELFRTADMIGVPAAYIIFFGRSKERLKVCKENHSASCARCSRLSIALLPALEAGLAAFSSSQRDAATAAYNQAVPLEDLADPSTGYDEVYDLNLGALDLELQDFLRRGQAGARHVARTIFAIVANSRLGQLSAPSTGRDIAGETTFEVFSNYPDDVAHYGIPYYRHIFRGLRSAPPSYVTELMTGRPVTQPPGLDIAGIVVVQS